jgi:hypothetical protein
MTYVTPDDIHAQQMVLKAQAHLKLAPGWLGKGSPYDAATYPALNAAPMMPLQNIPQYTLPTRAVPGRNATTTSPQSWDARDVGPGGFTALP